MFFNRESLAHLSATGEIAQHDNRRVLVTLQGQTHKGTLSAQDNGTAIVRFDQQGAYYGEDQFEILSPLNNNYTAHSLDYLRILR